MYSLVSSKIIISMDSHVALLEEAFMKFMELDNFQKDKTQYQRLLTGRGRQSDERSSMAWTMLGVRYFLWVEFSNTEIWQDYSEG